MIEDSQAMGIGAPRRGAIDGVGLAAACALALLFGALAPVSAQAQTTTVAGPAVMAAQFDGDLSKITFSPEAFGNPPAYRPRLRGPVSTKSQPLTVGAPSLPPIGPLAAMPSPVQNFPGLSFRRRLHRRTVRRRLAARPQRRRRPESLHCRRQQCDRHLQQDGHPARLVHGKQSLVDRRGAALHRQQSGRPGRALRSARRPLGTDLVRLWDRFRQSRVPIFPMHCGLEDQRPGCRRVLALRGAHGSGRRWIATCQQPQRLRQVRPLARLSLHVGQRIPVSCGKLQRRRIWILQSRRHVQRGAAYLCVGLPPVQLSARLQPRFRHGSEQQQRQGSQRGAAGPAEFLCFGIADCIQLRGPQVHARSELWRRRHLRRADQRQSGVVPRARRKLRRRGAATQYHQSAGQHRRPDHAEGAISQGRRRRVAVGDAQCRHCVGPDGHAMGADQHYRRYGRYHAGAAADLYT